MAWEYLENDRMDERFRVAIDQLSAWLKTWTHTVYLDLNCGTARILRLLPPLRQYIGNDVLEPPAGAFTRADATFWKATDAETLARVQREPAAQDDFRGVDGPLVLSCFGFSNSSKQEDQCSPTLEATYREMLRWRPGFAVLETAVRWGKPTWTEIVAWSEWTGYEAVDIDVHQTALCLEWRRVRVARRLP